MIDVDPKVIKGPWDEGYALDKHTISSTMIGYNEFGHPEFDTQRSPLGELVYKLKYKGDKSSINPIAEAIAEFVTNKGWHIDVIVPVPPSKQRLTQPIFEIAEAVGRLLAVPVDNKSVAKNKRTPQMKDVGDHSERVAVLKDAFTVGADLADKVVLLVDDLFQSGATLTVVTEVIKRGKAKAVYALALTRTRN